MCLLSEFRSQILKMEGVMDCSGSDDLKGITGVGGHQLTAGSTVIVVRQIIIAVVFQLQV